MRLVFDLQEAQTENQYRSSGRYSLLLAKALARCKTEHELFLLLNASFPDAVESIRAQFDGLLPQDNIRVFDIPSPAQENKRSNEWRRKAAELLCESYINSLYPDAVYISNIFTGWADNAVISLDAFPSSIPHIVGVHSLPDYQDTCEQESEYGAFLQRREGCLQHTDLILTTSVSIQSRLQERLSIDGKKIKLTPPSISPSFKPSPSTQQDGIVLCERYNLKSPFLLYVGNANASSEATTLCKAFSELSGRERTTFSLVFIGLSFKEETEVKNQSNALGITESVFTIKHLPVDDLIRFYNTSYLSIFPEQDKAAVFPLLEAMSCGAPILVANSPLARGLIESESVFFEPRTPQRLAQLIKRYISDNALRDALKEEALSRSQSFSLDRSALDVWKKIEDLCFSCRSNATGHSSLISEMVNPDSNDPFFMNHLPSIKSEIMPTQQDNARAACAWQGSSCCSNRQKQFLVDVSTISLKDIKTGIQRVVRSILGHWLQDPPEDYRIELIRLDQGKYVYAKTYMRELFGTVTDDAPDSPVLVATGDIFVGLDLCTALIHHESLFSSWRARGIQIFFVVYDILPVLMPDFFPYGEEEVHKKWLKMVLRCSDGLACISNSVAKELYSWALSQQLKKKRASRIGWFHLGADIEKSAPTKGLPENYKEILEIVRSRITFLMVGTVEPRKGHLQTLAALDILWRQNYDVNLVIVGKEGWEYIPARGRRSVFRITGRIVSNEEFGARLLWLDGISDEFLELLYAESSALIYASEGEGFGLPLIEAALHKIPIISRDIPVFREVAGESAFYFKGLEPEDLAEAIRRWVQMKRDNTIPTYENMSWITWEHSARLLMNFCLGNPSFTQYISLPPSPEQDWTLYQDAGCDFQPSASCIEFNNYLASIRDREMRPLNILTLSTYPIDEPRHGGQIRVRNITDLYKNSGFNVQSVGVLGSTGYPPSENFLPCPEYNALLECIPEPELMDDWAIGMLFASNDQFFQALCDKIKIIPDVIEIENPWFIYFVKRYICEKSLVFTKLVYSSQNIEFKIKESLLSVRYPTETEFRYTQLAKAADIEATRSADAVVCVSEKDMLWHKKHTDRPVLLAPNGVSPWQASDIGKGFAIDLANNEKYALFCSSMHLPNIQGFFDMLEGSFGSLDSDQKLIVAGAAGDYIKNDPRIKGSAKLYERTHSAGVVSNDQLAGLLECAHCIILPITQGGGTNLKTAEALWAGKHIVATTGAMRGFEKFMSSPGVQIADTKPAFKRAIRLAMESDPVELSPEEREARRCVLWESCLSDLPSFIEKIARG